MGICYKVNATVLSVFSHNHIIQIATTTQNLVVLVHIENIQRIVKERDTQNQWPLDVDHEA